VSLGATDLVFFFVSSEEGGEEEKKGNFLFRKLYETWSLPCGEEEGGGCKYCRICVQFTWSDLSQDLDFGIGVLGPRGSSMALQTNKVKTRSPPGITISSIRVLRTRTASINGMTMPTFYAYIPASDGRLAHFIRIAPTHSPLRIRPPGSGVIGCGCLSSAHKVAKHSRASLTGTTRFAPRCSASSPSFVTLVLAGRRTVHVHRGRTESGETHRVTSVSSVTAVEQHNSTLPLNMREIDQSLRQHEPRRAARRECRRSSAALLCTSMLPRSSFRTATHPLPVKCMGAPDQFPISAVCFVYSVLRTFASDILPAEGQSAHEVETWGQGCSLVFSGCGRVF
jgi:hypothetical protein